MRPLESNVAPTQGEMSFYQRIELNATDADQHAHNLSNWQQQYDQMSAGKFYGQLVEMQFNDLQCFQEHTSQALRQSCNTWDQSLWIGIPVDEDKNSKINGLNIEKNDIMCRPGNNQFELITPHNFDIYGLVVKQDKIQRMAEIQNINLDWTQLHQQDRLKLPRKTITSLRFILNNLLVNTNNKRPVKLQHDVIMMALLESLENSQQLKRPTVSFLHRQHIVEQSKAYLRAHQDSAVSINDLCTLCHVSRRTLQYSFETILCVSPLRYLRISRLNGARRELLTSDKSSIADIAAKWGFWHVSQFTQDYKQLFNELPSVTLRKSNSLVI